MIGMFVDGSFLPKAWRERCGASVLSYDALRTLIEQETGDRIGVAYWFDAQFPDASPNERQRAALLRAGFNFPRVARYGGAFLHSSDKCYECGDRERRQSCQQYPKARQQR